MARIKGTAKDDTLEGTKKSDKIMALEGDDTIIATTGGDKVNAGDGRDYLVFNGGKFTSLNADFLAFTASFSYNGIDATITFKNFEGILGSSQDDNIFGGDGDDFLSGRGGIDGLTGRAGNDTLDGGAGYDLINGNEGNDRIHASAGTDDVYGGADDDTIDFRNASAGVSVDLSTGSTAFQTSDGDGANVLHDIENVAGSEFGDTITGSDDQNYLSGMAGDDNIGGGASADTLRGGTGADTLTGGDDDDVFVFDAIEKGIHDTVTDFNPVFDVLAFSKKTFGLKVDGDAVTIGGSNYQSILDTQFEFNDTGIATAKATRLIYEADTGEIYYDADGSGGKKATLIAVLEGAPSVDASDIFVL